MIEPPLMIFKNQRRNYPMRNVPDSVPGVAYRTGPKGCMYSLNMLELLRETRVIKPLPQQKLRHLFIDNCSGHNRAEEILCASENIRNTLVYFPPNTTELVQPCDALVIQKIKSAWRKRWDEYKLNLIQTNAWTEGDKLQNPGNYFSLKLTEDSVRNVNSMREKDGLIYARKAMILCGLALIISRKWEEGQLKPELQNIITKNRAFLKNPDSE